MSTVEEGRKLTDADAETLDAIYEPPDARDSWHRVAYLEREVRIRERDERAARREMDRLTDQIEQHVRVSNERELQSEESSRRIAQLQLELDTARAHTEQAQARIGALERELAEDRSELARNSKESLLRITQLKLELDSALARAEQAEARIGALERELAEVRSAAGANEREAAVERERAERLRTEAQELRQELAGQAEELAAYRERLAGQAQELEAHREQLAGQAKELMGRREQLVSKAEELVDHKERLVEQRRSAEQLGDELDDARTALAAARKQLEGADKLRQRTVAEYAAQVRSQQQTISALSVGLSQVRDDVERAAASRTWRYGHSLARVLARLARRHRRTQGALAAALARIGRVEREARALPPGPSEEGSPSGELQSALPPADPGPSGPRPSGQEAASSSQRVERSPAQDPVSPLSDRQRTQMARRRAALAEQLRDRLGPSPKRAGWPRVSVIVPTRDGRHHLELLYEGLVAHTDYPELEVVIVDNASTDDSLSYLRGLDAPFPLRVIENEENLSFAEANARGAERATGELLLFLNNDVEAFEPGWLKELVCALDVEGVAAVGATLLHPEDLSTDDGSTPLVQHRAIRFRWQDGMVKAFNCGDGEGLWDAAFGLELRASAVTAACMLMGRETFERVGGFGGGYRYGTEDVDLGLRLLVSGGTTVGVGRAVLVHRESSSQNRASREFRRMNRQANRRLFLERWGPQVVREYRLGRLRRDRFWTDGQGPHVAITLTSLAVEDGWGDWYSGHEIGDALAGLGWRVTYVQRKGDQWYDLPDDLEYVLSLMDPFDLRRVPPHITTIAWIRNWTERWLEQPWFDRADVLLASSAGSAELIEQTTGRRTIRFPLAVNPARFKPQAPDERFASDYVFTGNWWGKDRDIQRALEPRDGERVLIYGKDWDKVPEFAPYARGELPYTDLPAAYASAKLVLDDTQGPTLPYGALNARVFDALAAGTLPVTNCTSGVHELFDEDFPVWSSKETLRRNLDELLADEERRQSLVRRYREVVLTRHTYAHRAAQLRRILVEHEQRLSFCVKIGAPNREVAPLWGDLHFARSLTAELRRRGHRTCIQTLDEWEQESGLTYDVVVHLKGLSRYHPKPGQFNLLWSISHPDELTGEECDGYDMVGVASPSFAMELSVRTATPVVVLEQAADPRVMRPDPREELAHDLVYVANSRNVLRPIARDLLPTDHDLAIWGSNWSGLIDTSRVVSEHVPNDELRHVYSSAGIVLNDHWEDMREHGYISNRIYDALACGAFVISDEVPGLGERFGEAVACFGSSDELRELADRFLADPAERRRRGELGRELVLERHTFAHRADELLELLDEHMQGPQHPRRLGGEGRHRDIVQIAA
jgi:GT2 family glycosyltransferase/spore maturation protein CgeB